MPLHVYNRNLIAMLAGAGRRQLLARHLREVVPLQQMPHRFPVHPGRLHRHMRHSLRAQELVELQQRRGGRRKSLHFIVHGLGHAANTRNNTVLMNDKPRTARIQTLPYSLQDDRCAQQFGVLAGSPVQLINGLSTQEKTASIPTPS